MIIFCALFLFRQWTPLNEPHETAEVSCFWVFFCPSPLTSKKKGLCKLNLSEFSEAEKKATNSSKRSRLRQHFKLTFEVSGVSWNYCKWKSLLATLKCLKTSLNGRFCITSASSKIQNFSGLNLHRWHSSSCDILGILCSARNSRFELLLVNDSECFALAVLLLAPPSPSSCVRLRWPWRGTSWRCEKRPRSRYMRQWYGVRRCLFMNICLSAIWPFLCAMRTFFKFTITARTALRLPRMSDNSAAAPPCQTDECRDLQLAFISLMCADITVLARGFRRCGWKRDGAIRENYM